jgi:riboflavin biosynthesis pyrimidine reductase
MVLTEGGPRLLGDDGRLDELFLTVSPVLAAARELLPCRAELLAVGRLGSYLFLRYAMRGTPPAAEPSGG